MPDHTNTKGAGTIVMIDAIQVGVMTPGVPPGPVVDTGTVAARVPIIILILRAKQSIAVRIERVTSSSWDIKSKNQQTFTNLSTAACSLKIFLDKSVWLYTAQASIICSTEKILIPKHST